MKFDFANQKDAPRGDGQYNEYDDEEWDDEDIEETSAEDILKDAVPWAIAILFHVALLLITMLIIYDPPAEEVPPPMTPHSVVSDVPDPDLPDPEVLTEETTESPAPFSPTPTPTPTPSVVTAPAVATVAGATFAAGNVGGSAYHGNGTGQGPGMFGGNGGGSPMDTVFVIDASGSLCDTLAHVKKEMKRMLNSQFSPDVQFGIVFFYGPEYNDGVEGGRNGMAMFESHLVPGTPENVQKAIAWIDTIQPGGSGSAVAAIESGLDMDPALLILLSDNITGQGQWEVDQAQLIEAMKEGMDEVAERTRQRPLLQTIQFCERDPLEQYGQTATLLQMAEEVNGNSDSYSFVSRERLGLAE